uniref:DNA mismatch repair protein MLH1 n=1 Tax=Lygus hesperus TaxID=30085 RepID=A0A0K8TEG6_LYGHE
MGEPGVIKKLDEVVVNRIAAGEVIQRPANALKELLENSLDAKSTNIQVTLKNGGLKLLQIQDNGTGIRKQDMDIVCERFTTSKLTKFEDLTSIATFGFRGEALASISHVAHLTITTKTATQQCAFRAQYEDGKLKGPPKPCAGNQGTLITVEDLFYNIATRKKVLKNPTEEFVKIADVVGKYAVHNPAVGFILKRQGETTSDIKTNPSSTHVDAIRAIYGENIARELMEVEFSHEVLKFKMHGYISNVNYSTKKQVFILFINNRLVDSTALRKAVEREYAIHLPSGAQPFIYLSLALDPKNVDVNVHPTKHEVHFLHEDEIIDSARSVIESKLLGSNKSRVFYTQVKLPGVDLKSEEAILEKSDSSFRKVRDNVLVRTDSSVQKIDKFFHSHGDGNKNEEDKKNINRREIRLTSVLTLKREIEVESSLALRDIISDSTYVGLAEREEILIQHNISLYMLHAETLKEELFYQLTVFDFGNYGAIKFVKPLPLRELVEIGLEDPDLRGSLSNTSVDDVLDGVVSCLCSKKEMLLDYFSIEINDQHLCTIPLLLENYVPDVSRLPGYLLRLACDVDWTAEEPCFRGICRETARFFSYCNHYDDYDKYKWNIEHIVYPAMKKHLLPHKKLAEDKSITNLISLPALYKVFERC